MVGVTRGGGGGKEGKWEMVMFKVREPEPVGAGIFFTGAGASVKMGMQDVGYYFSA